MTPDQRTQLLRRLYLFGPFLAALGGVIVGASPLGGWFVQVAPVGLRGYVTRAEELAPLGWFVLTVGCAVGTCLDMARWRGKTGVVLAIYLVIGVPLIAATQVFLCSVICVGGCMLVTGQPRS